MIITLTLNPCVDTTLNLERLILGSTLYAREVSRAGAGKGVNVSRVVRNLGGETLAVWFRGGFTGEQLAEILAKDGLPNLPIDIEEGIRAVVTIHDEATGQTTRIHEPGPALTDGKIRRTVEVVKGLLTQEAILVLSGSVPCQRMNGTYAELTAAARERGVKTILDTRDAALRLGLAARPYLVKSNQDEAAQVLGRSVAGLDEAVAAAEALVAQGATIGVVSMGSAGAVLAGEGVRLYADSPKVKLASAVGSGDSMVGAMSLGILGGWELPELLRWGVAAGAANAAVWDAGAISRQDVEALARDVTVVAV